MLWPEEKVKTTDQSSSKETQTTGQHGGAEFVADLKVHLRLLFIPPSLSVFPKEVKNSLSSAGTLL